MQIRHQITAVEALFGWSVSIDSTLFSDTLEADEDVHIYRAWTHCATLELAAGEMPTLVRIAQNEVENYSRDH